MHRETSSTRYLATLSTTMATLLHNVSVWIWDDDEAAVKDNALSELEGEGEGEGKHAMGSPDSILGDRSGLSGESDGNAQGGPTSKSQLAAAGTPRASPRTRTNPGIWRQDGCSGSVRPNSWVLIDARGAIERVGQPGQPCPAVALQCPSQDGLLGGMGMGMTIASTIDGCGALVLPGLHDSHIHVMGMGESDRALNLRSATSITDLQIRLHQHSEANPPTQLAWLQGVGWDQTDLGRMPTRHDIDAVCPDRPVFLWRACWHIGVANSCALRLAGVSLDSPFCGPAPEGAEEGEGAEQEAGVEAGAKTASTQALPPGQSMGQPYGAVRDVLVEGGGGSVQVDGATGLPTGVLKERAVSRVTAAMAAKSPAEMETLIAHGLRRCVQFGLTAVQTNDEGALDVYRTMQSRGELPIRVFLTPTYADLKRGPEGMSPHRPNCLAPRGRRLDGASIKRGELGLGSEVLESTAAGGGAWGAGQAKTPSPPSQSPPSSLPPPSPLPSPSCSFFDAESMLVVERLKVCPF